ncbi:uncharacterized protein DNG_07395 [Cephalotrichum gorgonifer]|uniref:NAD dependent epimerase/dehydratase n=1 Tax=Cephalotrichum gorgonifer TaxID=2041049 RepID=A0AAE8SXC9_9PEZI|nr:uncharacterized protein DNG_07395 [Cephalotrichum gorgonifer]
MGNEASKPKSGTNFQVIGAGMPHTGTAALASALRILLEGPIYHGGTQIAKGNPRDILLWTRLLRRFPPRTQTDRRNSFDTLSDLLDGYAGTADQPAALFVPELLELYPDAIVICTVRNPESWERSMRSVSRKSALWSVGLGLILLPLPGLRHFVAYANCLRRCFVYMYEEGESLTTHTYRRHIEWLKEVVPEHRLFFVNVREGWIPLCDALGMDVPDVPFPAIDDEEAMRRVSKETIMRALKIWTLVIATILCAMTAYRWFNR